MEKIILFETFSGYGGASFALEKAKIKYECVGYSEINKYAIKCFDNNFPGRKNFGDISKIEPNDLPDFNLLTGGFPCQDVSIAGKRDLSKGRTMLIEHIFRIVAVKKPKYILLENVKGLLSMPNLFNSIKYTLHTLGYGVEWRVLNSKEHGVPQNRERVWIVCKLGGWGFGEFMFPIKKKLNISIKDILEEKVDDKYYLSDIQIKKLKENIKNKHFTEGSVIKHNISPTLCSRDYKDGGKKIQIAHLGTLRRGEWGTGFHNNVSPTFDSSCGSDIAIADYRNDEGLRIRKDGCSPSLHTDIRTSKNDLSKQIIVHNCITEAIGRQGSSGEFFDSCKKVHDTLTVELQNKVKVRKYKVDINKLCNLLRKHKKITNKEISEKLLIPITKVEHWFREDKSFAIPDANIWFKLKKLLEIDTDEFDKSITEFEERDGVYDKSNRGYLSNGISPTLTISDNGLKVHDTLVVDDGASKKYQTLIKNISPALKSSRSNYATKEYDKNWRRLTPIECFRLMGFLNDEIKLNDISDSQLYKLAGNGWDINVASLILKNMFKGPRQW